MDEAQALAGRIPLRVARRPRSEAADQFLRFCAVGTSGYCVNLAVFTVLIATGLHFRLAAVGSFATAVTSNYVLHRTWTFSGSGGAVARQYPRFLVVSLAALAANELALGVLVAAELGRVAAQAAACIVAIPVSYLGNRLWAFRHRPAG